MPLTYHRFTVDEFHRMAQAGVLQEDDRVELIDGQVVEMTPIGPRHAGCVKELARLLYRAGGDAIVLGVQDPIVVERHGEPQPDIAVLRPRRGGYRGRHPGPDDVFLVVEIAETSVEYDRSVKIPLYARAGIPEAWLVDLPADRIEVYRDPAGGAYASQAIRRRGDTLAVLLLPGITVGADEILG